MSAKDIIIATGSQPIPLPGVTLDNQRILDSTDALLLSEVPRSRWLNTWSTFVRVLMLRRVRSCNVPSANRASRSSSVG